MYSINDVYDLSLLSYLKTFVTEHKQHIQADEHHFTMNGDFLSPSTLALFNKGELMIRAMNELGITHSCFGNHEFDIEWPDLADRMQKMKAILLNTNMAFKAEETKGTAACSYPYIRHTLKNGANVLYTGYLTEETYENMKIVLGDKPYPVTMCPAVPKALADEKMFVAGATRAAEDEKTCEHGMYPVNEHPYQNMDEVKAEKFILSAEPAVNKGVISPDASVPGDGMTRTQTTVSCDDSLAEKRSVPKHDNIDVSIALTHQFMPYDRELALKTNFHDVILGGHEHEPFCQTIVRKYLKDDLKFPMSNSRDINAAEEEKEKDQPDVIHLHPFGRDVNKVFGKSTDEVLAATHAPNPMCAGEGVRIIKAGQDALFCIIVIMDFIPKADNDDSKIYDVTTPAASPVPRNPDCGNCEAEICDEYQIARSSKFPYTIPVSNIPDSILTHSEAAKSPVLIKDTRHWTVLHHCQLANVHKLEKHVTPDPALVDLYEEGEEIIRQNGNKVVYTIPEGVHLSSRNVRAGPNSMARFLADAVREATGSAACLLPAGKVRGNKDYEDGVVKVVDIMSELPFLDNQCCVVEATLEELEYILKYSHQYLYAKGGFLQTDNMLHFDVETNKITMIHGVSVLPTDPRTQVYPVAIPLTQLKGMDNNPYLIKLGFRNNVFDLLVDDLHLLQHLVFRTLEVWQCKDKTAQSP